MIVIGRVAYETGILPTTSFMALPKYFFQKKFQ